ncbi:NACHT domain-containing protein [Streptomyces tauricus]|uniref:NACHT domain-containing protein n=1 Tax=Streptomyces tauricus TaxID=68274 RepID=UPI0033E48AF5
MDTLRGGRDGWDGRGGGRGRDEWRPPSEVRNIVRDSTIEYLVQAGWIQGDLVVNLPPAREPVDTAAEELARSVRAQWSAEVAAWELGDIEGPLAVRWLARWGATAPAAGTAEPPVRAARSDRLGDIADTLLGLDARRLLVLGGPGSGKSTLLAMTVVLLAARHLGDVTRRVPGDRGVPVPLLLSLESWDAESVGLRDWLVARLTEDHPGLPRVAGAHPARRLVRDGRVLPVLDGLDELPDHRRAAVVRELNAAPRELGFVLASRTQEYRTLDVRVVGASDIEALPVGPRDAAVHLLRTADRARHEQWGPVLDELAEHPEGPLGQALSTPLMIWLARRAHRPAHTDPARLADRTLLPTREAVESHLMDTVIPAAFAPRPHDSERLHAPGQWNPARARGWLAFLARELQRHRTGEFAWWRLNRARAARFLAIPTLVALCIVLAESMMTVVTRLEDTYSDSPQLNIDLFDRNYLFGAAVMATGIQLTTLQWYGDRFWEPRRRANPLKAGAALRSATRAASVRRALTSLAILVVPGAFFLLTAQGMYHSEAFTAQAVLGFILPALVMLVIAAPADTVDAATPDELLAGERRAGLLTLGVVAPLLGLGSGAHSLLTEHGTVDFWVAFAKGMTGAVIVLVAVSPWCLWVVSKAWLAVLGRVPWSLMEFLRDAHGGGLLQRYGGTYRFRHLRLQEHLAGRRTAVPAAPLPAAPTAADPRQPLTVTDPQPAGPRQPFTVTGPQPHRPERWQPPPAAPPPAAPPAAAPAPRLSGLFDQPPPLHELRGYTVVSNDHEYVVDARDRRLPLAHWPLCGLFMVLAAVRMAATGNWDDATGWAGVLFWPAFAAFVNVVALMLPKMRLTLRIDHWGIAVSRGRRSATYAWEDVLAVRVRQVYVRGRNQRVFGPHVRLRPGAPEPPRMFRGRDGWWLVMALHFRESVPADLADALSRFSGGRWRG